MAPTSWGAQSPRGRRALSAVAMSVLAHAAAALLLLRPAPQPPPEGPIEIEVREVAPAAKDPPKAQGVGARVPLAPTDKSLALPRPSRKEARGGTRGRRRAAAPSAPDAPPVDVPSAGRGASPLRLRAPVLSGLLASPAQLDALVETPPEPDTDERPGERREREPSRFMKGVAARAAELRARERLEAGAAPPIAFDYGRDASRILKNSDEVVAELARAFAGRSRSPGAWTGRYLREMFNQKLGEDPYARALQNAALLFQSRVCLVSRPDHPPAVELAGGSGIERLDEIARDLFERAVARRPPESDHRYPSGLRVCYAVTVKLSRIPPLPTFGCGLNLETLEPRCVYPFKELVSSEAAIDGVEPL